MRIEDVYVAGTGAWLPPPASVAAAVAQGLLPAERAQQDRLESVGVADSESPPWMAARAAQQALARSACGPDRIELLLHATVHHQGVDMWAPASYIQREALGNRCPAFEVRQMSNGGMAALDLAARHLVADAGPGAALVTAADRFCPPAVDRWATESGMVFGDGGAALVLSRGGGFARLRSVVTVGDSSLEPMHRGDEGFTDAPMTGKVPVAMDVRAREFVRDLGLGALLGRLRRGQEEALEGALADAGVALADIAWFVLPHFGWTRMQAGYFQPLRIDPARTTWPWGRTVGHLGAADQFAGLDRLVVTRALRPGQVCLLCGIGAGFTWSCAVVEVLSVPVWTITP